MIRDILPSKLTKGKFILAAAILGVSISAPASAALITYDFTGTVTEVESGTLFGAKKVGESFSGSFTLDTEGSFTGGWPGFSNYSGAFDVTVEGTSYAVGLAVDCCTGLNGITFNSVIPEGELYLTLLSSSDIFSGSTDIPLSLPTLSEFDLINLLDVFDFNSMETVAAGVLTSLSLRETVVPAPGAIGLLGVGLLGLGIRRRLVR